MTELAAESPAVERIITDFDAARRAEEAAAKPVVTPTAPPVEEQQTIFVLPHPAAPTPPPAFVSAFTLTTPPAALAAPVGPSLADIEALLGRTLGATFGPTWETDLETRIRTTVENSLNDLADAVQTDVRQDSGTILKTAGIAALALVGLVAVVAVYLVVAAVSADNGTAQRYVNTVADRIASIPLEGFLGALGLLFFPSPVHNFLLSLGSGGPSTTVAKTTPDGTTTAARITA